MNPVREIDNELILFRELFNLESDYHNFLLIPQGGRVIQHLAEFLVRNKEVITNNIYDVPLKEFLDKYDYIPQPINDSILKINNLRKDAVDRLKSEDELNNLLPEYLEIFNEVLKWFGDFYLNFLNLKEIIKEIKQTIIFVNNEIESEKQSMKTEINEYDNLIEESHGIINERKIISELTQEIRELRLELKELKEKTEDTNETVHEIKDLEQDTNETVHNIDYKMDQFLEKFEIFYNKYAEDQEEISKKIDSNLFTDEEKNKFMNEFTEKCVKGIRTCVENTIAKKDFKREQDRLIKSLTDKNWKKLSRQSQTWLTTSIITYKGIKKLNNVVDYSGVCLLITKAIEIELRKRFYKGFSNYLNKHYEKNYYEYHTSLLKNPPHYKHNYRLRKNKDCDLGRITYILCYKKDEDITDEKIHQNNLDKLIEYSQPKYFKDLNEKEVEDLLYTYGEYVDEIRREYRNPSAHTGALDKDKANDCFDYVCRKTEVLKKMLNSFDE